MKDKWDKRYSRSENYGKPFWLLENHQHLLAEQPGRSLDLACGLGTNALLLAELGYDSHGWDISSVALQKLQAFAAERNLSIGCEQRDVEKQPPEPESFDLIVVSQFLHRPICPAITAALKPGGLLFYQSFHRHKNSGEGPTNPRFLLARNELLALFPELAIVYYREDGNIGKPQQGLRNLSYLVAEKLPGRL